MSAPNPNPWAPHDIPPNPYTYQPTIKNEDDDHDHASQEPSNFQPTIEIGSSSEDEGGDRAQQPLNPQRVIEIGSSSDDDDSESDKDNDRANGTNMSPSGPGHARGSSKTPIELGSSSGDDDEEADDNNEIKMENSDTHMSGADSSDHAPRLNPNEAPLLLPSNEDDVEEGHAEDHFKSNSKDSPRDNSKDNSRNNDTNMAASDSGDDAPRKVFNSSSENGDEVNDVDHDGDDSRMSAPPPSSEAPTNFRSETDAQIEKNERRDEVEPGLTEFRKQRDLHVRQLQDLNKKALMVSNRIDKLNDDVEQLRQQWGDMEREKAALLTSSERYEQKTIKQERRVHKDDKKAKKYHDYLTLAEEVLMLEDSDDEEDEDRPVFDWGAFGHGGTAETEDGK